MKIRNQKSKIKNFGFSLIEMLIAISVFSVVATISTGALLSMSDAQQKILALRIAQDNLSYFMDTFGKEVRTGMSYHCGSAINLTPLNCPSGDTSLTFRNALGYTVTYRLNNNRVERSDNGGASFLFLTPSDVTIDYLRFYVIGATEGDHIQPRVTVVIKGTAGAKEKIKTHINIQTTISQRQLDS